MQALRQSTATVVEVGPFVDATDGDTLEAALTVTNFAVDLHKHIDALPADVITNGAFGSDTGWTKGSNWQIAAGVADQTTPAASDLSQTPATALVESQVYTVTYTVAGRTAGAIVVKVGGTSGISRTTNGAFTEIIVAGSGALIEFTADGTWDGNIDDVSMELSHLEITPTASGGSNDMVHANQGTYYFELTAIDLAIAGRLKLVFEIADALPRTHEFMIMSANAYGSMYGTADLQVDVVKLLGAAAQGSGGRVSAVLANAAHGGAAATIALEKLTVASTTSDHAIEVTGQGAGAGIRCVGGATGHGVDAVGGGTSGSGILGTGGGAASSGIKAFGTGAAPGLHVQGTTTGPGMLAQGGAVSGSGISVLGGGGSSSPAITVLAAGDDNPAIKLLPSGSGAGILGDVSGNLSGSIGSVATDGITAASIKADSVTKIQSGLATAADLLDKLGAVNEAAADGDPSATESVMQYVKQIVNILAGTAGVVTYPAEAAPGNAVSLAEVIRAIHADVTGLAGATMRGTDSGALASVCTEPRLAELDPANLATDIAAIPTTAMRGTDAAATAADLLDKLGAVNEAAADGDPSATESVMQYVKQIINILAGTAGVVTYPAEAAPGNAVSLAEVIRAIHVDVTGLAGATMRGTDSAATGANLTIVDTVVDAIKAKTDLLAFTGGNVHALVNDLVAASLAKFLTEDTGETDAVAGSVGKIAQGAAGGNVTVEAFTQAGLAAMANTDTGEATAIAGSVAKLGQGSGVTVLLGPPVVSVQNANRVAAPVTLEMFQKATRTFIITIKDKDGNVVDLSGMTLRFIVEDTSEPPTGMFKVEAGTITITGADNEVANVPVSAAQAATALSEHQWLLREVGGAVLGWGPFVIKPAVDDVP